MHMVSALLCTWNVSVARWEHADTLIITELSAWKPSTLSAWQRRQRGVIGGACTCSLLLPSAGAQVNASAQAKPTAGKAALGVGAAVLGVGAAALLVFQEVETVLQASNQSSNIAVIVVVAKLDLAGQILHKHSGPAKCRASIPVAVNRGETIAGGGRHCGREVCCQPPGVCRGPQAHR